MSGLLNAYEQLLVLVLIMLLGYALRKREILGRQAMSFLTDFVLYISFPAITIVDMMLPMTQERKTNTIYLLIASVVLYLLYIVAGRIMARLFGKNDSEGRMYEFATVFSNSGYMGLPIISAIYGSEAVYYLMIYGIVYNFLFYAYGMRPLKKGGTEDSKKFPWKESIFNIGVISTGIGLFLAVTGCTLPKPIVTVLTNLGATTTSLSMIIIGAMVAQLPFRELFAEKKVYLFSAIRLILIPLLTWGILELTPLKNNEWVVTIAVIVAAMPAASGTAMIAQKVRAAEKTATQLVIVSSLLCCITIPLFTYFLS